MRMGIRKSSICIPSPLPRDWINHTSALSEKVFVCSVPAGYNIGHILQSISGQLIPVFYYPSYQNYFPHMQIYHLFCPPSLWSADYFLGCRLQDLDSGIKEGTNFNPIHLILQGFGDKENQPSEIIASLKNHL